MSVVVIGLNHRTVPLELLERMTVDEGRLGKALHDAWLLREIGKAPYDYAWGSVASEYDAKGCVSEIIVTYAQ